MNSSHATARCHIAQVVNLAFALVLAFIGGLAWQNAAYFLTAFCFALCLAAVSLSLYAQLDRDNDFYQHSPKFIWVGFMFAASFSWQLTPSYGAYWLYIMPMAIALTFNFVWVCLILLVYSLAWGGFLLHQGVWEIDLRQLATYTAVCAVAVTLNYLIFRLEYLLEPFIRLPGEADLIADLGKEINRAEREGTGLSLLAVCLAAQKLSTQEYSERFHNRAMQLIINLFDQRLSSFNSFYQAERELLFIVFPYATRGEVADYWQTLEQELSSSAKDLGLSLELKAGVASLNVGDSAETLIKEARQRAF